MNIFSKRLIFGVVILFSWAFFDAFNFASTQYTLHYFIGNIAFAGVQLATLLAMGAIGMDLAGIASIFTPERASKEPWWIYLLGFAWLIAAVINTWCTYWFMLVNMSAQPIGVAGISKATLMTYVPWALAIFVFLLHVSIIGTVVVAGDNFLVDGKAKPRMSKPLFTNPFAKKSGPQVSPNPMKATYSTPPGLPPMKPLTRPMASSVSTLPTKVVIQDPKDPFDFGGLG